MPEEQLLQGSCHCGAVRLTLPSAPEKATKCNCSICRRLGGLWAYYEFGTVRIEGHPENTAEYIWGDKTLRNVRCKTCGCATHWEPLVPEPGGRHGVNLNNFDPRLQEGVLKLTRFRGHLILIGRRSPTWATPKPPYPAEFRRQMVELVQAGRTPHAACA